MKNIELLKEIEDIAISLNALNDEIELLETSLKRTRKIDAKNTIQVKLDAVLCLKKEKNSVLEGLTWSFLKSEYGIKKGDFVCIKHSNGEYKQKGFFIDNCMVRYIGQNYKAYVFGSDAFEDISTAVKGSKYGMTELTAYDKLELQGL